MAGCRVFTLPPSISGDPVTSATVETSTPADRRAPAVLPDETIDAPSSTSRFPSSGSPLLSATEIRALRTGTTSLTPTDSATTSAGLLELTEDVDPPALHLDPSLHQHANGAWVLAMLHGADPGVEAALVVFLDERYRLLDDDGPVIHLLVHQVDRDARNLGAPGQGVGHGVSTRERRQQRRVDVQYPPLEGPHHLGPEHPHESGEHDVLDGLPLEEDEQRLPVRGSVRVQRGVEELGTDPSRTGPLEGEGAFAIGHNEGDPSAHFRVVEQRLEVRPRARCQHGQPRVHGARR